MAKYDKVTPGSPLQFSAGLYNDLVDMARGNVGNAAGGRLAASMRVIVTIKNTTGSDRSRFDCMALGATRFTIGTDGKESVIYDADVADPDKPPAILQTPIAAGKYGPACIFGYTLAKLKQAGSASDLLGTPYATDHNLEPGSTGSIKILAAPSTSAASLRPILIGGGTGTAGNFVEDVRWVDPVLEYKKGGVWFTIDTAEACSTSSPFVSGLGI